MDNALVCTDALGHARAVGNSQVISMLERFDALATQARIVALALQAASRIINRAYSNIIPRDVMGLLARAVWAQRYAPVLLTEQDDT